MLLYKGHHRRIPGILEDEAEIFIIIEYRTSRVTATGTVFALRDVLRKSKDIIDRVVSVV